MYGLASQLHDQSNSTGVIQGSYSVGWVSIYHIDFTTNSQGVHSPANLPEIFEIFDSATSTADIHSSETKLLATRVDQNSVIASAFKNHP